MIFTTVISESLHVVFASSPASDDELSASVGWSFLDGENVATTWKPSDGSEVLVEVELVSVVGSLSSQSDSVLSASDVGVSVENPVSLHLGLDSESLSVSEAGVGWHLGEVSESPLLVCTVVACPESSWLVLFVSSTPDVDTFLGISSVVESAGSALVDQSL